MEMEIKEFITNNYNYISAIATNEYNKEKNKALYKNYGVDDFISEVMLFFIKKYDVFDESLCKPRTFIIKNCSYCSGELKAKLNKSNRYIDLVCYNESDLISYDENDGELNPYRNVGKEEYYKELSTFSELNEEEKLLCSYKLHGLEINEISKILGCSRQTVWRKFNIIKEKVI